MLPGEDGLSICRRLRGGHDNTPIIMLTAKAEEIDRIVGLEMGADDYLSSRSILASCWPGSTRSCAAAAPRSIPAPQPGKRSIAFGPYVLNLSTRTLTRNREQVPITTGEFSVLKVFARHPKIPLSRDKLMELARGRSTKPSTAAWTCRFPACAS